jgi:hypothetical protein
MLRVGSPRGAQSTHYAPIAIETASISDGVPKHATKMRVGGTKLNA